MEVRGYGFSAKLAHHRCNLTPMISGMIREMLHEVRQADLCRANLEHFFQGFVRYAVYEFELFSFDFSLL
jgi:hypothetical protein